jgi:hypothetical protein
MGISLSLLSVFNLEIGSVLSRQQPLPSADQQRMGNQILSPWGTWKESKKTIFLNLGAVCLLASPSQI